jgi:hypothetical protein
MAIMKGSSEGAGPGKAEVLPVIGRISTPALLSLLFLATGIKVGAAMALN